IGLGPRLSPALVGTGQHKQFFYIFDYCQTLDILGEQPETTEGRTRDSLSTRLFKTRLEMIRELDTRSTLGGSSGQAELPEVTKVSEVHLRGSIAESLHAEVAAMNPESFVVRPK